MLFQNRKAAGRLLAQALKAHFERGGAPAFATANGPNGAKFLVLGIPRGGMVVAAEVAKELGMPLDVWLARKIGAPGNKEFAIGSIAINGEMFLDRAAIEALGVTTTYLDDEIQHQTETLGQQMVVFRGSDQAVDVRGVTVLLVDDGVATGSTAFAALGSLKRAGAAACIFAAPVAPVETVPELAKAADAVVILESSGDFVSVGQFYEEFEQVSFAEVVALMEGH